EALADPTVVMSDVLHALHARQPVVMEPGVTIDGRASFRANALQIDVLKTDFDRRAPAPGFDGADDPSVDMLFEVANSLIYRLRSVIRASGIYPVVKQNSCWRIEFLTDAGEPLPPEPGLARARNGGAFAFSMTPLVEAIWQAAAGLPRDFRTK